MKLLVSPIYGWGWFDRAGNFLDVPPHFELEVFVTESGEPFKSARGFLHTNGHGLSNRWVLLSPRHVPFDGNCNVYVFEQRPIVPKIPEPLSVKPDITGFAQVQIVPEVS